MLMYGEFLLATNLFSKFSLCLLWNAVEGLGLFLFSFSLYVLLLSIAATGVDSRLFNWGGL